MPPKLDKPTILAARLARQGFTHPVDSTEEYLNLVRLLQPITPIANTRPGDPPRLGQRVAFDDGDTANRLRVRQQLVKGRFAGGMVGYVLAEEIGLYANAFCRPLEGMNHIQEKVLDAVERLGPITSRQIKEETGLLSKAIGPALQRLQQAFLLFEEQTDEDWERPWYTFPQAYPDVKVSPDSWQAAATEVVHRFFDAMVFATAAQVRDWTQFPRKGVEALLQTMEAQRLLMPVTVEGLGAGWILAHRTIESVPLPASPIYMLHKADYLVRATASELKERYKGVEVLEYLHINGAFQGAVLGHWGFKPYDVEDIRVDLPTDEREQYKASILTEVARVYHPPQNDIVRYHGELI